MSAARVHRLMLAAEPASSGLESNRRGALSREDGRRPAGGWLVEGRLLLVWHRRMGSCPGRLKGAGRSAHFEVAVGRARGGALALRESAYVGGWRVGVETSCCKRRQNNFEAVDEVGRV